MKHEVFGNIFLHIITHYSIQFGLMEITIKCKIHTNDFMGILLILCGYLYLKMDEFFTRGIDLSENSSSSKCS